MNNSALHVTESYSVTSWVAMTIEGDLFNVMRLLKGNAAIDEPFHYCDDLTDVCMHKKVLHAINELAVNQRMALLAHSYGEMNIYEVATAMKVPAWIASLYLKSAQEIVMKTLEKTGMETAELPAPPKKNVLKRVFDRYTEDTITDEQVERVLAPVLMLIKDHGFERPRWHRFSWQIQLMAPVATAATLIATVAITCLSGSGSSVSGYVYLEDVAADNIEVLLFDTKSMEAAGTSMTDQNGAYSFHGIPDGSYKLCVLLPKDVLLVDTDENGIANINQTAEFIVGSDS